MKRIKLFMVMLLSLIGMTAAAQQPTLISSTAKPVTSSTLTTGKYLIAAGTTDSYYFNVGDAKVNAPLSEAQVFTYTVKKQWGQTSYYLQRNINNTNEYVYVDKSWSWSSYDYIYSLTTSTSSSQSMTISFNSNSAASIYANDRYIVSNGNDADVAGLSSDQSYDWYFYKAAVVKITYRDVTNNKDINTVTYVGRVGDQLQWPDIDGYTRSSESEATYSVERDASVTVNYTNDNGKITEGDLKNGRYFMQNKAGVEDVWMTSYKSLVSLIPNARSFWSVWVVKCVDVSNNKYEIYNEGNRNVMTPCTDPYQKELSRDGGYLYYDTAKKGYFVGDITDANTQFKELTLTLQSNGNYMIRSEQARSGYYLSFDNSDKNYSDEFGNVLEGDHCIKSISSTAANTNPYWTFVAVTNENVRALYNQGVTELDAYVGGLTTMDLPDADVEELKAAKQVVAKYQNDKTALQTDTTGAAVKYREFVEAINNMRSQTNTAVFCQHLVEGRPFWVETIGNRSGYLNRMLKTTNGSSWTNAANSSVDENNSAGTFYVTPVKNSATVINPKTGIKTTYDTYYTLKNSAGYYMTRPTGSLYSNSYSIVGKEWSEWSKNADYLKGLNNREVTCSTSATNVLEFVIIPIVPGIYQMCDIAAEWQGDPFLTFNGDPRLHHYRVSESFSYFKFKTYNEYTYNIKNPLPENSYGVGTYGELLNSKISKDRGIKAYYIRAGKHAYKADNTIKTENADANDMEDDDWGIYWNPDLNSENKGNADNNSVNPGVNDAYFTVFLDEVPTVDSDNILQGMQGYVLKTTATDYAHGAPGADSSELYDGVIEKGSAQDLGNNNMLHAALNSIDISTDTWGNYYDIFVLAYKSTDDIVGYWHQQPVKGVGIGFYHLKRGQTLPTGRCYLSTADLCEQLKKRYPDTWDNTYFYPYPKSNSAARAAADNDEGNQNEAGFRIVFRDSNGVQTAIEEAPIIEVEDEAALDAISTLYSLDGRKVTAPKSGEVYILNGKKVMF